MPVGFTPVYKIMKDDLDITDRFNDRCTQIQVILNSGGGNSDTCSITLDNRDFKLATPDAGAKLRIYLGYKEVGLADEGVFNIDTYEYSGGPHTLKITGNSVGFMGALKAPAFQAHEGRTVEDILKEIGGKGNVPAIVDPILGAKKIPFFNQAMSPLHMLHELERRLGAIAKFQDGKLIFRPRGDGDTMTGASQPVLILEPQMFAASNGYAIRFSNRTAYSKVMVSYRDPKTKQTKWVEHENPNRALGEDDSNEVFPYGKQMNSQEEAKDAARSMMDALRRQRVVAEFTLAKGDPWVRDQMPILIRDMFDPINGPYMAEVVTHTFVKDSGITTTIQAKTPNSTESFQPVDPDSPLGLSQLTPGGLDVDAGNNTYGI